MEFNNKTQEGVVERLTYAEQLVAELKETIRQKDAELQQKDAVLQDERRASDDKIKKVKLHAKAQVTSLNRYIEELKAQGENALLPEPQSKRQLLKNSTEMEEFSVMKQQLKEKEELIGTLQAQLSQTQAEQAAQLSSMQQVVREKDARFETQVRLHEDELLQLVTQAEVETEMQQNLRVLQRKLEEHEEALLGRARVVDVLQQELTAAEQRNQTLTQQLQQMEAEHNSFRNTVETEKEEYKILMEKMELEKAERESLLHHLQEEVHHLLEQLEQAGQAQADLQSQYSALEQKHKTEMEEKTSHILSLQKTEQEFHSAYDALKNENSKLLQDKNEQALRSAQTIQQLEEKLCSQITFLEAQNRVGGADREVSEISMIDSTRLNKNNSSTEESDQDVLEKTFFQKDKELSILLLEMKEAQEEIAFLKLQLQDKRAEGEPESFNQEVMNQEEDEGILPVTVKIQCEDTGQHFPSMSNEESSLPGTVKEEQVNIEHQNRTSEKIASNDSRIELKSTKQYDVDNPPSAAPGICQCHQHELERLKHQILELEMNFHKAEEAYGGNLDEKAREISNLMQLIDEFKKNAEDTNSAFTALSEERDKLLAQVQQMEMNLAEAERQRNLDHESQTMHHNLLTEQIYNLSIEAKSKDMKIGVLQNELDDLMFQCSEKSTLIKSLQSQLQEKEGEVLEGIERLRDISHKMEELSQDLSKKELEIAKMDQLLLEKKRDVESLQQTVQEKDQQVTEISFSMSEKMVQLNEEKFSLGVEIKTLKEQLNLLSRAEEAKGHIEEDKEVVSGFKQTFDELNPAGLVSREELQHELDLVKKENEQRKRKLQAALINRKELLQRVSKLEEELSKVKDECRKEVPFNESERGEMEKGKEGKQGSKKCVTSKCQEIEISLKQTISEKEVELEHLRKNLEEKAAAEEELKAVIKQMNQNFQEKTQQAELLQAEITESQAIIRKLTTGNKDAGDGGSAEPVRETVVSSPPGAGGGEYRKPELEEKILNLEKEKEHLQKKLQQALISRKMILKKAQEEERHLREELKRQKDDYNHLQEQFDKQNKEIENIGDPLKHCHIQIRESVDRKLPGTNQQETGSPTQSLEEPLSKAMKQQPLLESDLCPDWPASPGDGNALQGNTSIAQIKIQLEEIETEKKELELRVSSTTSELTKKSEEIYQLQEQVNKQGFEIQNLKTAFHEAEALAESLRQKLESSQLELAGLECLRDLKPELDELQEIINRKEEKVRYLSGQLNEKEAALTKVQSEMLEQEDLIKALHTQLEMQAKEHDEKIKQLHVELDEMKQKPKDIGEESKAKHQILRKLRAALISREELLKENKNLQDELFGTRDTIDCLTKSLTDLESQVSTKNQEKATFLEKLAVLKEEKEKLITDMFKCSTEKQNLNSLCESQKLALEDLTEDKENLVKEIESLKCAKIAESTEWQEKHKDLQKEYEILLQSYENVSNEAERIQHVVDTVRQEKKELYGKLRGTEASKKEVEKQLQEAKCEMDEMKAKMRKFAKSKQQEILKLEEKNDQLRAEVHPIGGTSKDSMEVPSLNSNMKEELERIKTENETLSKEFEALKTEKNSLNKEIQDLKHQIEDYIARQASQEATEKRDNQMHIIEEASQSVPGEANEEDSLSISTRPEYSESFMPEAIVNPDTCEEVSSHNAINNYLQQIDQFKERIAELEEEKQKETEFSQTLKNEKNSLLSRISAKDDELKVLQEEVTKINLLNQQIQEELARVSKLKNIAEEEKDDLEERLMNQLAELNGSIGNYHQDVLDAQIKNTQLESEMQNLKKCMSELEEEKQQLVKERSQVESKIRKEYLEKIQGAQKEPSNKSHTQELQELLKEKQQEIKQLQKDCIKYQEKISALERTVKALEFVQTESQKDLETTKENLAQANEHSKKADTELNTFRVLLDDTQSEAARVLAENLKLKKELQSNKESIKSQMKQKDEDLERRLEQVEEKYLKEKKNMQEKLDALSREKVLLEEIFGEVQNTLNKKDKEVKQLQENLDSTVAQLAAFTKSMSSLQDDRDRVIDEAKKWERKFSDAIQTKEEEIRHKEENCSILKDQLRQMSIHMEELKINISRLEHDRQIWESKTQTEVQLQQKVCDTLQGENKELLSQLEETRHLYHNSQNDLAKLESELKMLRDQWTDLNNSFKECKENKDNFEKTISKQEIDIQNYKFSYEQLETDLQASRQLTSKLHEEINMKEQKIISLLSAKEQAIQEAVAELHKQHDKEMRELENLLSQDEEKIVLEEENRKAVYKTSRLMETLKSIKKENMQQKAQLNSFIKSVSSLQDDRDRILDDYQKLEEQHLSVILKKDQLIQEAAAENNELKEEIRCLRSHMDDLNSENAKLDAELVQYRKDLNQVISRKDCQQKQLLEVQLQQNMELQSKYAKLEEKLKKSEEAKEDLQRSSIALQAEKQGLSKEIDSLKVSISQLKKELMALQEEGALGPCQAQLKVKEEEVQNLNTTLSSSQKRITELEEELVHAQVEAAKKVGEIEDKMKKELKHLHHDARIMRNETETAEERVAELARDLVEMEQKLLMVTKENKDLTAQIQSFGRSMSSLQNSRDEANEELDKLKRKYDTSLRELAQLKEERGLLSRERNVLVSEAAFSVNSSEDKSLPHLEKLNQQFLSKDEQLLHLSSRLEDAYNQVQSFSKAMASLQNERDHLLKELEKHHRTEEGKQRSAAQPATSPAEVQSLKKAMSSLQNDRDRLLKELKNLQQQYLEINQEVTELHPLKAQLQEYQDKTKSLQIIQEELKQENLSWQHELRQLRMEKSSWEMNERQMKEQYLMAISDRDQQISHLQNLMRELRSSSQTETFKVPYQKQASEETSASLDGSQNLVYETELLRTQLNDNLKEIHQKELRIQLLNRKGAPNTDIALGAPQEMNGAHRKSETEEMKDPQLSLTEAQKELSNTKQEVNDLKKLLDEERDQRVAAESALSVAEEQIRRLEHSEWDSARTPLIGSCGAQEQKVLIDIPGNSCRRVRREEGGAGWKRVLRSVCYSRTRVRLLAAVYVLMIHVLFILCFTGHL
ncbi:golgin subfamily B member 1 isoform X1 [Saccopteryx leptura]|uniref:golgin subfamily B member 1 isoform X1 n=1 Tax=Saccopteryx leptura TaxID=249018 RepID=UPI00339C28FB